MKKDKNKIIEETKQHINNIRKNSPTLTERDIKIALGKVFVELKIAKKHDNNILKELFKLK